MPHIYLSVTLSAKLVSMTPRFNICVTSQFSGAARELLENSVAPHQLGFERTDLAFADIAFGQPDRETLMASPSLRWAHISSAGYTNYDRDDVRAALQARGAILTTSSHVFDEPCAQHAAAMILAQARQLPQSWAERGKWNGGERRANSFLLNGQNVLFLGFGAIGVRLAAILAPFEMRVLAVRRQSRGEEGVTIIGESMLAEALAQTDHVVNILPESESTRGYVSAARFAQMKQGAIYYSIGRGATTEQDALLGALHSGHLGAAYLDVTTPEPLLPDNPLWSAPNCFITPHTAGGHRGEDVRLVQHFLNNLRAFERGEALTDRVI